jgi:mono/diheme cytochrome c family protein
MRICKAAHCAIATLLAGLPLHACGDDDDDGPAPRIDAGNDSGQADASRPIKDADVTKPDSGAGEPDAATPIDPVMRGKYISEAIATCGECHTPRNPDGSFDQSRLLAGVECFVDVDPADDNVGCLHSRNLTDHETGLQTRSDEEIKDMLLKGVRPDEKALHPAMPYWVLANMSDEDADAIVAYLRTVRGVDHMVPASQPPFTPPDEPAPTFPEAKIPLPRADYPQRAAAMRGRYIAGNIGLCLECHTPRDEMNRPLVDKAFQGGHYFARAELGLPPGFPERIYTSNITPHATGIADWTVDDVVAVLERGEDKDQNGAPLCPPMPVGPMGAYAGLTDRDTTDIAHYLLSLPPGDNAIAEDCEPPPPPDADGGT